MAKNPCVKHICELGFNAGHSSALWLLADPDNIVTSFDIFMHDYAPVAQRFLGSRFPGRQALVAGDSLATVPGFVHSLAGQEIRCDIILVDGGHGGDVPYKDIVNFMPLANPTFHILLMDDIHCNGECEARRLGHGSCSALNVSAEPTGVVSPRRGLLHGPDALLAEGSGSGPGEGAQVVV